MILNEWEQSNIEVLTSREMGEWLSRRENRLLDKIRAEIKTYEADCILADDSKECKECDKIVFGSIYRIIDKYRKGE